MTFPRTLLKRLQLTLAAAGVAAALTPVQAQTPAAPATMAKPAAASTGMANGTMPMGQGGDMKSSMGDMQSQMMAMKSTGNPDVDFAMMMRIHHQGAIAMAEAQLKNGKNPQMKKMAQDIIAAQKKEIAVFDTYVAKNSDATKK